MNSEEIQWLKSSHSDNKKKPDLFISHPALYTPKSPRENLEDKFLATLEELKVAQKKLMTLQAASLVTMIPQLVADAALVGEAKLVASSIGELQNVEELRNLTVQLRDRLQNDSAVAALFAVIDAKPMVVVAVTKDAEAKGIKAGDLVRAASAVLGGGGGGKADIAQGGGSQPEKIDEAIAAIRAALA